MRFNFFLQILIQIPQTEVHTENQLPSYPRSGLKVPGVDVQADICIVQADICV